MNGSGFTVSYEAARWHKNGEKGISSEAIFDQLVFGSASTRWITNYPSDPDDLRRCELLLRAVPEFRPRLSEMAACGPTWAALAARWAELVTLIESEVPGVFDGANGRAARTYALMSEIQEANGRR